MPRRKHRSSDSKPRDPGASASGGSSVPRTARRSAVRGGSRASRNTQAEGESFLSEIAAGLPAVLATLLLAGLPWAVAPGLETRDPGSDAKWLLLGWGILAIVVSALLARRFDPSRAAHASAPPVPHDSPPAWPLPVAAALIVGGILASLALAPTPVAGARVAVRECMLVSLALALASVRFTETELRRLILACMVSATGQAALTLWQFVSPPPGAAGSGRSFMTGTFGNPEYVAGWLAPSLAAMVVAGALARGVGIVRGRAFPGAGAAILAASIFVGGNRGAALGAFAGICFATRPWRFLGRPAGASRVAAVSALALAVLAVVAALGAHLAMRPESRSHSLIGRGLATLDLDHVPTRHRIGLATIASRLIARDPIFGVGPGRFPVEFDRERGRAASGRDDLFDRDPGAPAADEPRPAPTATPHLGFWRFGDLLSDAPAGEAHCDPLQWWAEYGFAPLLGLLLAVASALDRSRDDARGEGPPDEDRAPARLLLGAMLATLAVGSLFAFPLHRPARAALFWALIGLLHAGRRANSDAR